MEGPFESDSLPSRERDDDMLRLDLHQVDRRTALRTWLAYHGVSESDLARRLGVSPSTVARFVGGQRASKNILERLVREGLPRELLERDA